MWDQRGSSDAFINENMIAIAVLEPKIWGKQFQVAPLECMVNSIQPQES